LREFELTARDIELLTTTADRLYEASQIGVAETWSNPLVR
jgi:hypothetical protein